MPNPTARHPAVRALGRLSAARATLTRGSVLDIYAGDLLDQMRGDRASGCSLRPGSVHRRGGSRSGCLPMCTSRYGPSGAPERIARFAAPMATPRLLPAKGNRTVATAPVKAPVTA